MVKSNKPLEITNADFSSAIENSFKIIQRILSDNTEIDINSRGTQLGLQDVKNATVQFAMNHIEVPGAVRFNEDNKLQVFVGGTEGEYGWVTLHTYRGIDGKQGLDSISNIIGVNLGGEINAYPIFKNLTKKENTVIEVVTTQINNLEDNILTNPNMHITTLHMVQMRLTLFYRKKNIIYTLWYRKLQSLCKK